MAPRVTRSGFLFCALAAALPLALPAAEPRGSNDGEIVSLPPLMVEEKARPLEWRFLEAPGLEVLSVSSDRVALEFLRRLYRLSELLTVLVPERFWAKSSQPEGHILFNEEAGRARSQEVIAEMLRKGGARLGARGVVVADGDGNGGRSQRTIRFVPNMRLWDSDSAVVFSILHENTNQTSIPPPGTERLVRRETTDETSTLTFAYERVALLLERRVPALPDWFVEGTLGFYETATLRENDVALSAAKWVSPGEAAALLRDPEYPRTLLPMRELFARRRPKNREADDEADRIWRAQCALFVRWAVGEKNGARREALWKLVDRLETEPLTETLFREHFGLGFADARDRLSDYLPVALETNPEIDGPKAKPLPRLRFRPATELEIALVRGRWERMEIAYVHRRYPDLAEKYVEQARRTLNRAYGANQNEPRLLTELGLAEIEAGNPEDARDFLEAAAKTGSLRPRAGLELARLHFQAMTRTAGADAKLSVEQTRAALAPLQSTGAQLPPLLESYVLRSEIWNRSAVPPTGAEFVQLNEGGRFFPHASPFVMRLIYLNATNGRTADALALADIGLRHARDPQHRELFQAQRQELAAKK